MQIFQFFKLAPTILGLLPDGNSYGNKYFANETIVPGENWCEFEFNNKKEAIADGNQTIEYKSCARHGNMTYFNELVNYELIQN